MTVGEIADVAARIEHAGLFAALAVRSEVASCDYQLVLRKDAGHRQA